MSSWLNSFITLVSTFLGGYLVLKGQQATRVFQAERDDRQLLRDSAQSVFEEISSIRDRQFPSVLSVVQHFNEENRDIRGEILPFPKIAKLKSLLAVYFPSILQTLVDFEEQSNNGVDEKKLDFKEIGKTEKYVVTRLVIRSSELTDALNQIEIQLLQHIADMPILVRKRKGLLHRVFLFLD
ncbi:hypothetical protein [Sphingomonas echinoides]|uniref:hypothetical protein n=1 Tax=Sphingomonas echinoides TaxID=59803 RepID=UPI0024134607|nr:hypothetical protein [Sphingomonas echinoides]